MGIGNLCLNCGYVFHSQRTGKCPNCDESSYTKSDGYYTIDPKTVRQFKDFDKNGGDISSLKLLNKKITLIETSPKKDWVSLSIFDILVTFADYGKGPQVIYHSFSKEGFGINDIPKKLFAEAMHVADEIIHGH